MIKVRCPICEREMEGERADWPQLPFCSPRCKKIDFGRWLGGTYRVPAESDEEDGGPVPDRELS